LISTQITLPTDVYKPSAQIASFFDRLLSELSTLPGARQTGAVSDLPTGSASNVIISMEGQGRNTERVDTLLRRGNALESLGVTLLRGRPLQPEDQIGQPHAVVISKSLAKRAWPHADPIGRRIRFGVDIPNNGEPWLAVVGVVADVKARLNSDAPRSLLFMTWAEWVNQMNVLVRTSGDPLLLASAIRREINRLDPSLPVGSIETIDQALGKSLSAERFRTWLLICFAIGALLLAMLGIAGLLAYNTAQRTHEFGVRAALGADRRALFLLVLTHSLQLSGTGIAVGFLVSVFATRALTSLLYDTTAHDLRTFVAVPSMLALVALGASMFPAWRAVHTDPIIALRAE
jgi:putative ABC transport system permease protein